MEFVSILSLRGEEGTKANRFFKNLFIIASHKKPEAVIFQIRNYPDKILAGYCTL